MKSIIIRVPKEFRKIVRRKSVEEDCSTVEYIRRLTKELEERDQKREGKNDKSYFKW